jgi:hypothetical protein
MNANDLLKARPAGTCWTISRSLAHNVTSGRMKLASEQRCRICHGRRELTRHHLIPHAWFMSQDHEVKRLRNANANIVPLCVSCHRLVDGVRDPVLRLQKRSALRGALATVEIAFIIQVLGKPWFDEHYPIDP